MKKILVFEQWIEQKDIDNYRTRYNLDKTHLNVTQNLSGAYNVYISEDDGKRKCSISIVMPSTIKDEWEFYIDKHGFPIINDLEDNIFDFCLDKIPEELDINYADVNATELEEKNINTTQLSDNFKRFLQKILWGENIELSIYDDILFLWKEQTYIFHLSSNFCDFENKLNNFIGE